MTKRKARSQDEQGRVVVEAFVSYLSNRGHPGRKVECRPDVVERNTPDIDAIAGPFAIEHTSVDTVANQRRDTDYFKHAVDGIANELSGELGCRLRITVDWSAVRKRKGQHLAEIGNALKGWILTEVPGLPDGRTIIDEGTIPAVPFGFLVQKGSGHSPGIYFARSEPHDRTLSVQDRKQLNDSARKLAKYKPCKTTILLVESSDMALMNRSIILGILKTAFFNALPPGVDQVWYADTSVSGGDAVFHNLTSALSE